MSDERNPFDEQMDAIMERFREVARDARSYGFTVVVAVSCHDALNDSSKLDYCTFGDHYACLGLADAVTTKTRNFLCDGSEEGA